MDLLSTESKARITATTKLVINKLKSVNRPEMRLIFFFGLASGAIVVWWYWRHFHRYGLSDETAVWGQFGDYVGGILNPWFSFLAFVALIVDLEFKGKEAIKAEKSTQEQLNAIQSKAYRDELIMVIRTLSEDLDSVRNERLYPDDRMISAGRLAPNPDTTLRDLIQHAWYLRGDSSGPAMTEYNIYVEKAKQSTGNRFAGMHARLKFHAESFAESVQLYTATQGSETPIVKFYSRRFLGLGELLSSVGGTRPDIVKFYLNVEDEVLATYSSQGRESSPPNDSPV